jgi:hypothetical protein
VRLLRRQLHHFFREPLGDELVRVMLAEQTSVSTFDLRVARLSFYSQDRISLIQRRGSGARLFRSPLAASTGTTGARGKFVLQTYQLF